MKDIYKAISNIPIAFLKVKRNELGLTQEEFSKLFGMTRDCYRQYEEGKRVPPDNVFRMMKIIVAYYEKEKKSE